MCYLIITMVFKFLAKLAVLSGTHLQHNSMLLFPFPTENTEISYQLILNKISMYILCIEFINKYKFINKYTQAVFHGFFVHYTLTSPNLYSSLFSVLTVYFSLLALQPTFEFQPTI